MPTNEGERSINELTGWTSSKNTKTQIKLKFDNKEDAILYAKENNFEYEIYEANKSSIKEKSYSNNFTKLLLD